MLIIYIGVLKFDFLVIAIYRLKGVVWSLGNTQVVMLAVRLSLGFDTPSESKKDFPPRV